MEKRIAMMEVMKSIAIIWNSWFVDSQMITKNIDLINPFDMEYNTFVFYLATNHQVSSSKYIIYNRHKIDMIKSKVYVIFILSNFIDLSQPTLSVD